VTFLSPGLDDIPVISERGTVAERPDAPAVTVSRNANTAKTAAHQSAQQAHVGVVSSPPGSDDVPIISERGTVVKRPDAPDGTASRIVNTAKAAAHQSAQQAHVGVVSSPPGSDDVPIISERGTVVKRPDAPDGTASRIVNTAKTAAHQSAQQAHVGVVSSPPGTTMFASSASAGKSRVPNWQQSRYHPVGSLRWAPVQAGETGGSLAFSTSSRTVHRAH